MWFDATGKRLPAPLFPGSDTLGQLHYIMRTDTTIPGSS
jgi:predicted oxidoreductase